MQCGAKTRRGELCTTPAMGNGKCRMHGGKSLVGIASPTLVTGRHSKHLPTRLAARYEESLRDERHLELRHELALMDAHITDQLEATSNGESGELWKSLHKAWVDYHKAKDEDKPDKLAHVGWLIAEGYQEALAWVTIRDSVEQRRKLVDSEVSRTVKAQTTINEKQAMALLGAVASIIKRHVTDRNALASIARDLSGLVDRGTSSDN